MAGARIMATGARMARIRAGWWDKAKEDELMMHLGNKATSII